MLNPEQQACSKPATTQINLKNTALKYFGALIIISIAGAINSSYMYRPSFEWIRAFQKYDHPLFVGILRILSAMGEGHPYFGVYLLILGMG